MQHLYARAGCIDRHRQGISTTLLWVMNAWSQTQTKSEQQESTWDPDAVGTNAPAIDNPSRSNAEDTCVWSRVSACFVETV